MPSGADIPDMRIHPFKIILLFLLLLPAPWVSAGQEQAPPLSPVQLRDQLYGKLAGAISFEALYTLNKPDRTGKVRLVYSAGRRYWLLLGDLDIPMEQGGPDKAGADGSGKGKKKGDEQILSWLDLESQLLYLNDGPRSLSRLDLRGLFDPANPDNPWNLLLRGLPADVDLRGLQLSVQPSLEIAWQDENLALGMGVEFTRLGRANTPLRPLRVSWLEQTLQAAEAIREIPGFYIFVMPGNRLVTVDQNFGLLQSDVQVLGGKQEYNLGLEKIKPLKAEPPITDYYPDLLKLKIQDVARKDVGQLYFSAFVLRALALQEQGVPVIELISNNLESFVDLSSGSAMQHWLNVYRKRLTNKLVKLEYAHMRKVVIDEYNKFVLRKKDPDMSLAEFIDHTRIGQTLVEYLTPSRLESRVSLPTGVDLSGAPDALRELIASLWQTWNDAGRIGEAAALAKVVLDVLRKDPQVANPLAKK